MRAGNIYLLPILGTIIFVILFFTATLYYPGGNQVYSQASGFSWRNNYWCNLLMDIAINDEHNAAKPAALAGAVILALTLVMFWFLFFSYVAFSKSAKVVLQLSAVLSMSLSLFIFTQWHDVLITIAGIFGVIALSGTFIGLYKLRWNNLLVLGIVNLLLVFINNIIYYKTDRYWLPVIQKITFALFLFWICLICLKMFKKAEPAF